MPLSNYTRGRLAEQLADIEDWGGPGDTYVGLFTANPGPFGNSNEVTAGEYQRVLVSWQKDGVRIENDSSVSFPSATSNWGTITHFAAFDAQSGGFQLFSGELDEEITVTSGDNPSVTAGEMRTRLSYKTRTIRTFSNWSDLPEHPSNGEVAIIDGDHDTYHFRYDESLRTSVLGEGGWRMIYSFTGTPQMRKIPIGDGSGNIHPFWEVQENQGIIYTPNKVAANIQDDTATQSLLAYSKFYLPIKAGVIGRGNLSGLEPNDFNASGVQIGVGIRDPYEDAQTPYEMQSWIGVGPSSSYGYTTSRTIDTDGGTEGFTDLNDVNADHSLQVECQHEGDSGTEWRQVKDIENDNVLRNDESSPQSKRLWGGRIYIFIGEYTDSTDYSISPPDVTLRDIEVFV